MAEERLFGYRGFGQITASAGTVITRLVPGRRGAFTRLLEAWYTAAGTAHTLTVMRPLDMSVLANAEAAAATVIDIKAPSTVYDGGGTTLGDYPTGSLSDNSIAANDYVAIEQDDGTLHLSTVASVSSLAITINTALARAASAGNRIWFFGITTDSNPADGLAHPAFPMAASVTTKLGALYPRGFLSTIPNGRLRSGMTGLDEPMLLHSNNATAAGTLELVTVAYSKI